MKKIFKYLGVLMMVIAVICMVSCEMRPKQPINVNVGLGYPDKVSTVNPANNEHFLINRDAYVLSYNNSTLIPNWVSWHLCKSDMGRYGRTDFMPDPSLPKGFKVVEHADYTNSGFDRGHMCPSYSRSGAAKMRNQTYYMTNIVPQNHKNNAGAWQQLEAELQNLCKRRNMEAYIVSGPYGRGGETSNNGSAATPGLYTEYIVSGNKRITVPEITWKVAIVIPEGEGNDVDRISKLKDSDILVYAVWMPNDESVESDFSAYLCSIDFVEEMTGLDFFSVLTDEIEDVLESRNSYLDEYLKPAYAEAM